MEEQRYIGVNDLPEFEIEEQFAEQIAKFPIVYRRRILNDILASLDYLPIDNGWSQCTGGVINIPKPMFYAIEFLKQEGDIPLLLDVFEVHYDFYLDLILDNNTIELHVKRKDTVRV